jgi:hypothetical protein
VSSKSTESLRALFLSFSLSCPSNQLLEANLEEQSMTTTRSKTSIAFFESHSNSSLDCAMYKYCKRNEQEGDIIHVLQKSMLPLEKIGLTEIGP